MTAIDQYERHWTPAQHAEVGLIDATDALRATRDDLADLLARFPGAYRLNTDLRRLHRRALEAIAAADARLEVVFPLETKL